MVYGIYSISLKLKTPSEEGKLANFTDKIDDVIESVQEFNNKYRSWNKRIILMKIEKNFFKVLLILEKKKEKVSTRELRTFTGYLRREKNWGIFSRDTSKLFEGFNFSIMSLPEAKLMIEELQENTSLYVAQKEDVDMLLSIEKKFIHREGSHEIKTGTSELGHDITDEQALAIMDYLLQTKNLGCQRAEKEDTVLQIKDMLVKWL